MHFWAIKYAQIVLKTSKMESTSKIGLERIFSLNLINTLIITIQGGTINVCTTKILIADPLCPPGGWNFVEMFFKPRGTYPQSFSPWGAIGVSYGLVKNILSILKISKIGKNRVKIGVFWGSKNWKMDQKWVFPY